MNFGRKSGKCTFLLFKVLFYLNVCVLFFYIFKRQGSEATESQTKVRALKVRNICLTLNNEQFIERESLFHSDSINKLTNMMFNINDKSFHLCNILKGGSLSWKTFFKVNKIHYDFLNNCFKSINDNCSDINQFTRIIQVRHPFVRLLSAWRHIFEAEGWKNLEMRFVNNQQLLEKGLVIHIHHVLSFT